MPLGKVKFSHGIQKHRLTDFWHNQDVVRPTESVILPECVGIGLHNTTNSN